VTFLPIRSQQPPALHFSSPCSATLRLVLLSLPILMVLLLPLGNAAQTPAVPSGEIKGMVADENKPLAGARLTLANAIAGKSFTLKTDDFGGFVLPYAPYGYYDVDVVSADGERLLHQQISITPAESAHSVTLKIDVSLSKTTGLPGDPDEFGILRPFPEPNIKNTQKHNKEVARLNRKIEESNALILQANAAIRTQQWQQALEPLQQLTGMEPDYWGNFCQLGDVQFHLGQYQEAIGSYETAILMDGDASGSGPPPSDAEIAQRKKAVGRMLNNEGLAYESLHKTREAIAAFNRAAAQSTDPYGAYLNLCRLQYNLKNVPATVAACDQAIAAGPNKPAPYYFKGTLLVFANQSAVANGAGVPPDALEALHKYLELAPNGEYAAQVRQTLNQLGGLANIAIGHFNKN
jgi:tetratricopeptide (TPR) repeat protein